MPHGILKRTHDNRINPNTMVFLSCLLHLIVLSVLILSPSMPSPRLTFGTVYSVQLMSMSEALMEKGATSSLAREFMESDAGKSSVVVKKSAVTVQSLPVKQIEVKKNRESIVDKALENLRKNSPQSTRTEEQRPANAETKGDTSQSAKSGAIDRNLMIYYADIRSRIKGQWVFPHSISPKENLSAVINLRILRNGTVMDMNFEKRSGNRYFDDSAMKAIRKASPFPPFPEGIGDRNNELGISFHSKDLR